MDKILSINTIKNVFAALGAKTSDDNYGVALLDKTSGEPKGMMGMSDLASVLGALSQIQVNKSDNMNAKTVQGLYYWISGSVIPQNVPCTAGGSCLVLRAGTFVTQIAFDGYYGTLNTYIRQGYVGEGWKEWKKITVEAS